MRRTFDSSLLMKQHQNEVVAHIQSADHQIEQLNQIIYEYAAENETLQRKKIKDTLVAQNQFFA